MAGPKLLSKQLVSATVATERKQQIEKGIELAKKVDAVRDTLLNEEKRLDEFRTLSVAHVQIQIEQKIRERDRLTEEIRVLSAQSQALLPDIEEQWNQIKKSQAQLDAYKTDLYKKHGELNQAIALNIQRERDNEEEQKRIAYDREQSKKALSLAAAFKEDALKELMTTRSTAQIILQEATKREEVVSLRENELTDRERAVDIKWSTIALWELDLKNRERAVKDKYETLQRTLKRI